MLLSTGKYLKLIMNFSTDWLPQFLASNVNFYSQQLNWVCFVFLVFLLWFRQTITKSFIMVTIWANVNLAFGLLHPLTKTKKDFFYLLSFCNFVCFSSFFYSSFYKRCLGPGELICLNYLLFVLFFPLVKIATSILYNIVRNSCEFHLISQSLKCYFDVMFHFIFVGGLLPCNPVFELWPM